MKNIGIIGCGWLGLELAKSLMELDYNLRGTTTNHEKSKDLRELGIEPTVYILGDSIPQRFLMDLSTLIISFPMKSSVKIEELQQLILDLKKNLAETANIIFTSSISVYDPNFPRHDANSIWLNEENMNLKFEQMLVQELKNSVLILRLGGLISEDRHPIHFLAGKSNLKEGNCPVNLVHRSDIVRFVRICINERVVDGIYNLVFPANPIKSEYYKSKAIELNLDLPHFENAKLNGKIIESSNQINGTKFDYCYKI